MVELEQQTFISQLNGWMRIEYRVRWIQLEGVCGGRERDEKVLSIGESLLKGFTMKNHNFLNNDINEKKIPM